MMLFIQVNLGRRMDGSEDDDSRNSMIDDAFIEKKDTTYLPSSDIRRRYPYSDDKVTADLCRPTNTPSGRTMPKRREITQACLLWKEQGLTPRSTVLSIVPSLIGITLSGWWRTVHRTRLDSLPLGRHHHS